MGFIENGTAYFASDYLPTARTLESVIRQEGRLDVDFALDVLFQCLEILESIHAKGVLHRDLKPSNILLSAKGEITLIDFGASREWHADASTTHTVLFTPGYAPLEQMAERARRGPASDLFSLSATTYEMLAGRSPESATDRASGVALTPIRTVRPDVDTTVAQALEAGLALKYSDRPQSAAEFRELLSVPSDDGKASDLQMLDSQMVRLRRFSFERRQCPSCGGLLEEPRPLKKGTCPVCQDGQIRLRKIVAGVCPFCRVAPLKLVKNSNPIHTCPKCQKGWLTLHKKGLVAKQWSATCPDCHAEFGNEQLLSTQPSEFGRSNQVWHCSECGAQLDELADGRLRAIRGGSSKFSDLYPEEWDCIAAGLEPGAGNAECTACGADYFKEGSQVTLLAAVNDPYRFAEGYLGRLLDEEDTRWMAVGKFSAKPGLVCVACHTEFDRDGENLRLVRTSNRRLARWQDRLQTLEDWHRLAQDLPTIVDESEFRQSLLDLIVSEYQKGAIGFDTENNVIWRGPAVNLDTNSNGTLTLNCQELLFGGMFRKVKVPFEAISAASAKGDTLTLRVAGDSEPLQLLVEPMELTVELQSGRYSVRLTAEDLASRVSQEIQLART
jgi:hypothetical protein